MTDRTNDVNVDPNPAPVGSAPGVTVKPSPSIPSKTAEQQSADKSHVSELIRIDITIHRACPVDRPVFIRDPTDLRHVWLCGGHAYASDGRVLVACPVERSMKREAVLTADGVDKMLGYRRLIHHPTPGPHMPIHEFGRSIRAARTRSARGDATLVRLRAADLRRLLAATEPMGGDPDLEVVVPTDSDRPVAVRRGRAVGVVMQEQREDGNRGSIVADLNAACESLDQIAPERVPAAPSVKPVDPPLVDPQPPPVTTDATEDPTAPTDPIELTLGRYRLRVERIAGRTYLPWRWELTGPYDLVASGYSETSIEALNAATGTAAADRLRCRALDLRRAEGVTAEEGNRKWNNPAPNLPSSVVPDAHRPVVMKSEGGAP